ncbi:glycosyltransferase family 1 protein [Xylona heveae TC161]|uniref:Glycosyltransferase family 1 protein n=1 Tax=Xylona heveae (strain CBS 132557 / TC161) TaxID=1328760 RepID=A0A165GCA4_XYLHT|nr:glycosyltransferase family 1 protein [Xylona heveae TC161]KZF22019.1 glycosyltransferase family 1 protein [Xylona heveae TC161]
MDDPRQPSGDTIPPHGRRQASALEQASAAAIGNASAQESDSEQDHETQHPEVGEPHDSRSGLDNAQTNIQRNSQSGASQLHQTPHQAPTQTQRTTARPSSPEPSLNAVPPPSYGEAYDHLDISQNGLDTRARLCNDGRINININERTHGLSSLLAPALRSQLDLHKAPSEHPPPYIPPSLAGLPGEKPPPPLNVVIHVVGSRGDVQPFVALGQVLKNTYGHRVRLATHPNFREFVQENGLEFFSIGGDPAELMAFMVKNPGLMPGFETLRNGDVGKRRRAMYDIFRGCWRSCIEAGDGTGIEASDSNLDDFASFDSGVSLSADAQRPFVADAIIANPPSFAHIHCAEKLGVPLHMMFTMPYSPTQAFPHPLANIQSSNADPNMTNFISYALVDMLTFQGLGDLINRFREKTLGLEPVSLMWAPGLLSRLRIPFTYCWSPALIPKPADWGSNIAISGFYFLSLASNYTPDEELVAFLQAGPPPVYIGFGSIVVDDPNGMTKLIFDAVKKTGQRALVSKGWGGIGGNELDIPDGVFMLGNCPHDWLFKHVSCVVHHGGAGTTAAGIALGKPTVIVPFFGDQPFWGAMVAKAGAGPAPIPHKQLTTDTLAAAIQEALQPSALERAKELGELIRSEKGCDVGARSFHRMLDLDKMRCMIAPSRVAVWRIRRTQIRLSAFAAAVLGNEGLLDFAELKLYRPQEYDPEEGPWDPISGGASALLGTMGSLMMGFADFPIEIVRSVKDLNKNAGPQGCRDEKQAPERTGGNSETSSLAPESGSDTAPHEPEHPEAVKSPIDPSDSSSQTQPKSSAVLSKPPSRGDSMAQAVSGKLGRPFTRSRSNSPSGRPRACSDSPANRVTLEAMIGAGKSAARIVDAGVKSPMDFTVALAKGFHNAPKLYNDNSVRQLDKVTGIQSGLKAAGKEFGYGFYDGISGLVTHPVKGAKKEGFAGLLKGIGKGMGGVVLKPGAAIWGLPGYTFKGIYKEIQKFTGASTQNYIIAARTTQGYDDWKNSSYEERRDVILRWTSLQEQLQSEQQNSDPLKKHLRHLSSKWRPEKDETSSSQLSTPRSQSPSSLHHANTYPTPRRPDDAEFEEAIQRSVAETSQGNAEEDRMIERAIRASVSEFQMARDRVNDEDAISRSVSANVVEANATRQRQPNPEKDTDEFPGLKDALERSLSEQGFGSSTKEPTDTATEIASDENDEDFQRAIAASRLMMQPGEVHDEEIRRAIEESQKDHSQHQSRQRNTKAEDDIILEFVKKNSLAEQS